MEVKIADQTGGKTLQSDSGSASSYSFLFSVAWWKNALLTSWLFARHCAVAAAMFTLAVVVMVVGSWQGLSSVPHDSVTRIESLIAPALIILCTGSTTLILMGWALGVWLVKITAFCAACIQVPITESTVDRSKTMAAQSSAVEIIWQKKAYLAKFWLYVTLFLSPLIAPAAIIFVGKVLLSSTTYVDVIKIPPLLNAALLGWVAFLALLISEISLVALAVSSWSTLEPFLATKLTFKLSFKLFVPGLLVTALITFLNVAIASPQVLFRLHNPESMFLMQENVAQLIIETLWQGLTSVILWTFSLIPITELVRRHLGELGADKI